MYDHIYLTGFKKFGLHAVNPTEEVVNQIASKGLKGITCNIVEVTTVDVDQYIQKIQKELPEHKGKKVLHLHFGVGINLVYKLQTHSYNNKNFAIPDNIGYKPINQKIDANQELQSSQTTKVPVQVLFQSANKEGFATEYSTNPGRYLCNYIYFRSTLTFSSFDQNHSLFIHFPTHTFSPHQKNIAFVEHLLSILLKPEEVKNNLTVEK